MGNGRDAAGRSRKRVGTGRGTGGGRPKKRVRTPVLDVTPRPPPPRPPPPPPPPPPLVAHVLERALAGDVDCGVPYVFDSLHAGNGMQQVSKRCLLDAVLPRQLYRRTVALLDEAVYFQLTALGITWISPESDALYIPCSAARMARLVAAAKLAAVPSPVDEEMAE